MVTSILVLCLLVSGGVDQSIGRLIQEGVLGCIPAALSKPPSGPFLPPFGHVRAVSAPGTERLVTTRGCGSSEEKVVRSREYGSEAPIVIV